MKPTFKILAFAAALALPVALIATNVRLAFGSMPLYTYAIDGFGGPGRTGLLREDLVQAAQALISFFNSDADTIDATAHLGATEEPFFTEREAQHFSDVRILLRRVYALGAIALGIAIAALLGSLVLAIRGDHEHLIRVMRALRWSAYGTIGAIALIGLVAALGGFNFLFLQFHILSFSNDLWQATATDRMTQLFPQAFFFQTTLLIGLTTILQSALIAAGTTVVLRLMANKQGRTLVHGPAPTSAVEGS